MGTTVTFETSSLSFLAKTKKGGWRDLIEAVTEVMNNGMEDKNNGPVGM